MNTTPVSLYNVESTHLASLYLQKILRNAGFADVKTVSARMLNQSKPIDSGPSLVLVDQINISQAVILFGQRLRICFPESGLIVMGTHDIGRRLRGIFPLWVMGTVEYDGIEELPHVVREAARLFSTARKANPAAVCADIQSFLLQYQSMSRREVQILELLCLRLSNKEIACQLNITVATVKFHASHIYAKLKVQRRRELLSKAGLVSGQAKESPLVSTLAA